MTLKLILKNKLVAMETSSNFLIQNMKHNFKF